GERSRAERVRCSRGLGDDLTSHRDRKIRRNLNRDLPATTATYIVLLRYRDDAITRPKRNRDAALCTRAKAFGHAFSWLHDTDYLLEALARNHGIRDLDPRGILDGERRGRLGRLYDTEERADQQDRR